MDATIAHVLANPTDGEARAGRLVPTSSFDAGNEGYEWALGRFFARGKSVSITIKTAVEKFYQIDCEADEFRNAAEKEACASQGSFLCKDDKNNLMNVSTGFLVHVKPENDSSRALCFILVPGHAFFHSDGSKKTGLHSCSFSRLDADAAWRAGDICSYTEQSKDGSCVTPADALVSFGPQIIYSGYSKHGTRSVILRDEQDFAFKRVPIASCTNAPALKLSELKSITTQQDIIKKCDLGVVTCGAFTGVASDSKKCIHRSLDQIRANGTYQLGPDVTQSLVATYDTNFPGASGAGHYCLRSNGPPIPFLMSVAMYTFKRAGRPGSGAVSGLASETRYEQAFLYAGDRSADEETGDFNIASRLTAFLSIFDAPK